MCSSDLSPEWYNHWQLKTSVLLMKNTCRDYTLRMTTCSETNESVTLMVTAVYRGYAPWRRTLWNTPTETCCSMTGFATLMYKGGVNQTGLDSATYQTTGPWPFSIVGWLVGWITVGGRKQQDGGKSVRSILLVQTFQSASLPGSESQVTESTNRKWEGTSLADSKQCSFKHWYTTLHAHVVNCEI